MVPNSRQTLLTWWGLLYRRISSPLMQAIFVVGGLLAMIEYSVPHHPPDRHLLLKIVLWVCLVFFTLNMVGQLVQAWRDGRFRRYLLSISFLVENLVVFPVPIALAYQIPHDTVWLFASPWIIKLASLSPAVARLLRVLAQEAKPLSTVLILFLIVLLTSAVALHLIEGEVQPRPFGTLPNSLWWAVVTLTTTGYGDAVPETLGGRFVAGLVMISGLCVFGLLIGILATGFVEDSRRESLTQTWMLVKKVPFFRELDPASAVELARLLRRVDFTEGATVLRKGRPGDCMYFVASGRVEVDVDPPVRLGVGAFFGEMALLGSGQRSATVTAVAPTTLLVLEATDFAMFTATHPDIARAIEEEAQRRSPPRQEGTAPVPFQREAGGR